MKNYVEEIMEAPQSSLSRVVVYKEHSMQEDFDFIKQAHFKSRIRL